MKRTIWKYALPIGQLALALACHVYDPHEYRSVARKDHAVSNIDYRLQHSPAWVGRISRGINFPALVLDYPLRHADNPVIYEHSSEYTLVWITPRDVGFFLSILLFWFWVGWKLDRRDEKAQAPPQRRFATLVGLACGVVFGSLTGAYANEMIAQASLPWRQIAAFGFVWAAVIIAYFTWLLVGETLPNRKLRLGLSNLLLIMLLVCVLWIGGPSGASQALGEYLRPTADGIMPISANCTTGEPPPPNLMRIVESERFSHGLVLKRVAVCRSVLFNAPSDERNLPGLVVDQTVRWLSSGPDCCIYQYRRHFNVIVGGAGPNGPVIVEADLIQSRWDYLRLNWNRLRGSWFWPYPSVHQPTSE